MFRFYTEKSDAMDFPLRNIRNITTELKTALILNKETWLAFWDQIHKKSYNFFKKAAW